MRIAAHFDEVAAQRFAPILLLGLVIDFLVLLRRKAMALSDPQRYSIEQVILYIGTFLIFVVTLIAKNWAR